MLAWQTAASRPRVQQHLMRGRLPRRHGDKHLEMALVPFEVYAQAAEKLIDENPLGLKRVGFVSTEDPEVVAQAAALTRLDQGTPVRGQSQNHVKG